MGGYRGLSPALRDLGFGIMVRRRFDKVTGEPARLTQAQIKGSEI